MDFKLNLYNICVANKVVNWEQCTFFWYVDENKVLYVEEKVNDEIVVVLPIITVEW